MRRRQNSSFKLKNGFTWKWVWFLVFDSNRQIIAIVNLILSAYESMKAQSRYSRHEKIVWSLATGVAGNVSWCRHLEPVGSKLDWINKSDIAKR